MAYTFRTRAQIPQLRARQSTNSALKQESNHRVVESLVSVQLPGEERFIFIVHLHLLIGRSMFKVNLQVNL